MYDEIDFVDRPILNGGCTWDLDFFNECKPYVTRASEYFECGDGPFNLRGIPDLENRRIAPGFIDGEISDSVVERWSMPTRFGTRYRNELESRANITVICGAEARDFIVSNEHKNVVEKIRVRSIENSTIAEIAAKKIVLTAGTQECTRLLLRNPQIFESIGEVPYALGRYYQGHLSGKIASIVFTDDPKHTEFDLQRDANGIYYRRRIQFSKDLLFHENLLNTALWLDNPLYHDPSHRNGTLSMFYLAMISPIIGKRLAPRAIANSITKGKVVGIHKHIWNVIKDIPESLLTPAHIFYKRYCVQRKLPQIFLYNPKNIYALHYHAEQVPSKENRMKLGPDGETLEIHYRPSDGDIRSIIKIHELLDQWLRKCGCGYLDYWFKDENLYEQIQSMSMDGVHQNGTTRIGDSHHVGVVDRQLKVFGTDNLFVCSGSVLPTSSQANPTFFTGVLAVRLADYL